MSLCLRKKVSAVAKTKTTSELTADGRAREEELAQNKKEQVEDLQTR